MMEQIKGYFFALFSAVLLGLMAVLVKIVLNMGLSTLSVIFLRFSLSSLFLAVFLRIRGISFRLNREQFFILMGVGIVGYGLMNLCYYGAFFFIPVGLTSMIHYIYPVVVVLLARILYHNRYPQNVYVALIIGMAGAMILSFSDIGQSNLIGVVLALFAGICYGIYVVFMDHPKMKDLHGLVIVFYLSAFTALFSLLFAVFTGKMPWQGVNLEILLLMLVISLFCTVLALFLFREAVVRIGSTHTTIFSTMEPVSAAVLGVMIFHEKVGFGMLIGSVLILSALVMITFAQKESLLKEKAGETEEMNPS